MTDGPQHPQGEMGQDGMGWVQPRRFQGGFIPYFFKQLFSLLLLHTFQCFLFNCAHKMIVLCGSTAKVLTRKVAVPAV